MALPVESKGRGIPSAFPTARAAPIHPWTHDQHSHQSTQRAEGELERRHRKYESVFAGFMTMRRPNAEEVHTPPNAHDTLTLKHTERSSKSKPHHRRNHSQSLKQQDDLPGPPGKTLSRRPGTWRSDYNVNGGSFFGGLRLGKDLTYASGYSPDPVTRMLHPHIQPRANSHTPPAISMDLRIPPNFPGVHVRPVLDQMGQSVHLPNLGGRELNPNDLMQYATNPPVNRMWLYHKRIPWYITIVPSSGIDEYIRVGDVITGLFEGLTGTGMGGTSQVLPEEYWAGEMDAVVSAESSFIPWSGFGRRDKSTAREYVSRAWAKRDRVGVERERAEREEKRRGVRRVDWLSIGVSQSSPGFKDAEYRWIGLQRDKVGMWEILTEV
ncbi:hypothetical protein Moror_13099 [Moniliophthora roreri MCA 2997]|uniref:DUF6699 domain-containing protein n=1 Tax=Moniliophthora roreri (strain MCA 2997) TaxID=1381753 RepID=V2XJ96_MONRO|nr:hypothetical protein Moror_13099 [Moniliophthora roreri MCA 2997]